MPASLSLRRKPGTTFFSSAAWIVIGLLAIAALLLEHGFALSEEQLHLLGWFDIALAATFMVDYIAGFVTAQQKRHYLRRRLIEGALALLLVSVLYFSLHQYLHHPTLNNFIRYLKSEMSFSLVLVQCYLAINVGVVMLNGLRRFYSLNAPAPLLIASSYLMVICSGCALLMLPKMAAAGETPLSFQEAIFTATSAVTVTGLTIVEVGARLSLLGQTVLLFLIQIGGISLVAVVGLLAYTEGERMNIKQMKVLRTALGLHDLKDMKQMLSVVFTVTFALEALGALALFAFVPQVGLSWQEHLYWSLFHAVSAFCSAGFALQPDSLMQWAASPGLVIPIAVLVIAGGLGFPVALDLLRRAKQSHPFRHLEKNQLVRLPFRPQLRLQTRYALLGSAVLLLAGFVAFWVLEGGMGGWSGWSVGETFWASLFQSATLRSSGFNTVDLSQLGMATLVVMMVAMTIGAGPISTGGGMKTVTLAVLLQTLRSFLNGRPEVVAHNRTIPERTIWAAMTVFFFYLALLVTTFFALTLVAPQLPMRMLLFEAVSAVGTVGLSLGATEQVGFAGQLFLMVAMIVGKIGPLTLAIGVLAGRDRTSLIKYPREEVIVG